MRMSLGLLVAIVTTFCLWEAECANAEGAKTVSVCALAARPTKYDGLLVAVNARVESDGHEYATLFDESCKYEGVALVEMHHSADRSAVQKLFDTVDKVYKRGEHQEGITVTATIIGYFHAKPREFLPFLVPLNASNISVHKAPPLFRKFEKRIFSEKKAD